jgi:hypothetical protein
MKDNTPVAIKCLTVKKKDEAQVVCPFFLWLVLLFENYFSLLECKIAKIREEALIMIKSETQFGVQFIDLFLEKDTAYMVVSHTCIIIIPPPSLSFQPAIFTS